MRRWSQLVLVGAVLMSVALVGGSVASAGAATAGPGKTYFVAFDVPPPHPSEDTVDYSNRTDGVYGTPQNTGSGGGISGKTVLFVVAGIAGLVGLYSLRSRRRANW